ncbi:Disrupted in schizophrenia 1-like [Cricetulus griseus]|uniref:Disrupted in schizophrenia 1-like n=1 Tax=Cricetulus griseus TaxID=10029 RepID=G3GX01_CRIGR|nr:Disrupted in schizophrenia 1-like [Cricetulus griseus]
MRSTAGPGIGFLFPAAGMPCQTSARLAGQESYYSQTKTGQCGLSPSGRCQVVGSPLLKSLLAPAVASVGHLHPDQSSMRETPVRFGVHSRNGNKLLERLTRPCRPGDSGCRQDFLSPNSSKSLAPSLDVALSEGSRGLKTVKPLPSLELNGLADIPVLPGSQDTFTSSFSFIRLSLGAAGERGEAEGCLPSREVESLHQSPQEMAAGASSSDRPHEDPRHLWTFSLQATPGLVDLDQVTGSNSKLECDMASSSDTGFSSQDLSSASGWGDQGSSGADTCGWDALISKWEPVLQDYLLSNRRQLEVAQYEEDSEVQRVGSGSDAPEAPLDGEPRTTAQDSPSASITRRDWLIREKQQLQKEIEALQSRMSALEAKEQQLSQELEDQETLLQWQGCDLMPLVAQLSPGQLQEVSKALGETLTSASQAPFCVEPPETLRSLQERTKSLNLAVREITAQWEPWATCVQCSQHASLHPASQLSYSSGSAAEASVKANTVKYMEVLESQLHSCRCPLLARVWKADLEACQLLMQSLRLQEAGINPHAEDEKQMDSIGEATWTATLTAHPRPHPEEEKTPLQVLDAWSTHSTPLPHCAGGQQKEESHVVSAEVGEKCEAIGMRLLYLEDELHKAIHSRDEALFHILSIFQKLLCK